MTKRGFTLIEMLVSVAIFSVVMVMALGALLALSEANRKAQLFSEAINNFQSSLDSISRAVRTGSEYHCGGGTYTTRQDCTLTPGTQLAFLSATGQTVVYKRGSSSGECANAQGCILRSQDGGSSYLSITSPDIVVTSLQFYVIGAPLADGIQPKTVILINGYIVGKSDQKTYFDVQTSVTQRIYDL